MQERLINEATEYGGCKLIIIYPSVLLPDITKNTHSQLSACPWQIGEYDAGMV